MPHRGSFITIERHIADQEHLHLYATGAFSRLLRDLMLAIRVISREVRRAGLVDIFGTTGEENVHGERVRKLDVFSNETIIRAMRYGGHLCGMASEESEGLIPIPENVAKGSYVLLFDPLDGSSNIDINVTIGTIFSIYRRVSPDIDRLGDMNDLIQPGYRQVAAGYALYGSSTVLVYTTGNGVDMFTYDPTLGEFLLSNSTIRIPERGGYYSINEGNSSYWHEGMANYISHLKEIDPETNRPYSQRYIGTAVADVHRTLMYGGIFLYPGDKKSPNGKLRLMYEVNPLAMLIEQAGGVAIDGRNRVLDLVPETLHERSPLVCGSPANVEEALSFIEEDPVGEEVSENQSSPS
ncbi:MAG: class 1 fructose-bisphosphatase [Ignavibacteriae bacterium]|nr:class 1 fructose-bisphosphatase [Ignavibacteriota bacterium]MCB9217083.1 class 1 fructose-bisphosphatase [Ignavibacteria bacterium]